MWGIFFEDINFGADGGLYAELVKNRSFEFPDPLMGWIKISPSLAHGELSVRDDESFRHQQSALCPHPFGRHRAVWTFPTKAFAAWACARAKPMIFPRRSAA